MAIVTGDIRLSEPHIERAVYLCCLESIQNAAKHGDRGTSVTVQLHRTPGELQFSVRDTGCGFDPRKATRGKGLASLHDRVDTVGGHIEVMSEPGRGTTVSGTVPWPPRAGVGSSDPDDASDLDGWDRPAHQPETKRE